MEIRRIQDKVSFDEYEEAFSVNGYHFSPWLLDELYIYSEENNLLLSLNFQEFLSIMEKVGKDVEMKRINVYNSEKGIIIYINNSEVNIESIIDMYSQKILTLINGERIKNERKLTCALNDCRYDAIFHLNNYIYHYVLNLSLDYNVNIRLRSANFNSLINEIIIEKLLNKFKVS